MLVTIEYGLCMHSTSCVGNHTNYSVGQSSKGIHQYTRIFLTLHYITSTLLYIMDPKWEHVFPELKSSVNMENITTPPLKNISLEHIWDIVRNMFCGLKEIIILFINNRNVPTINLWALYKINIIRNNLDLDFICWQILILWSFHPKWCLMYKILTNFRTFQSCFIWCNTITLLILLTSKMSFCSLKESFVTHILSWECLIKTFLLRQGKQFPEIC